MLLQKARKLMVVLFLVLALFGASALGPRTVGTGKTISTPQHHFLVCGSIQLPPCG